jgi:hypothetical protein
MNKYIDLLRLKIKGYIIIDDFFPDEICKELRENCINSKEYDIEFWDYNGIDYDNSPNPSRSLRHISDKYVVPKISLARAEKYHRSWSFVYDNVARGVGAHADPSFINVNIWVTPDECVHDHNKNGLRIYKKKSPKAWSWTQYNGSPLLIEDYLRGTKCDTIPYKYNRAVIFRGNTFHATDNVHMKPGLENKRVNYTFLYKSPNQGDIDVVDKGY